MGTYRDLHDRAEAAENDGRTGEAAKLYEHADDVRRDAAETLAALDPHVWLDLADKLTCTEADALAGFLAAWTDDDVADAFRHEHADADEPGDEHYVARGTCSDCRTRDASPNADDGLCSECAAVTP